MPERNLDVLFAVAEAGPMLDQVEQSLRQSGKDALADKLTKLQQDVGLEIDDEMTGAFSEPPPGPESARLRAAYEPVTPARLALLSDVYTQLPDKALQESLSPVIAQVAPATGAGSAPGKPAPGPSP